VCAHDPECPWQWVHGLTEMYFGEVLVLGQSERYQPFRGCPGRGRAARQVPR